ncbi:hypothetical protein DH2020_009847 [Rehmannia glutinosa]|uniref:BRX domain-containing protein n=1 Tax=Rehmannia glutinosa TaxID=99300 RepID=A0ABR0X9T0_REHGL
MSRNYDNWERLVAAVLKREEIWQICHASSRSTTPITSTSQFDENSKSAKSTIEIEDEWVEQYEPGVYVTIADLSDGTRELKRVRFSQSKFKYQGAEETWWRENRKKVYEKYTAQEEFGQVTQSSISSQGTSGQANKFDDKKDETPLMGTRSIFYENVKPTNSGVEITEREFVNEWIENYEPGVNVTLRAFRDGTTNVIRVHFRYFTLERKL